MFVLEGEMSKWWESLVKYMVIVGKGWFEIYGVYLKGEVDMVLSYIILLFYY